MLRVVEAVFGILQHVEGRLVVNAQQNVQGGGLRRTDERAVTTTQLGVWAELNALE
jgi:hypothetical protein